jgi:hypothetical protein
MGISAIMTVEGITSDEDADRLILQHANERGKMAIPVNAMFDEVLLAAMDRMFDNDWARLIDVAPVNMGCDSCGEDMISLCRIFKLTQAGLMRLSEVSGVKN